jgi:tetratricopeptide (TPR) repeat protein
LPTSPLFAVRRISCVLPARAGKASPDRDKCCPTQNLPLKPVTRNCTFEELVPIIVVEKSLKPFEPPDIHHLRAALGWLELGNHLEANEELEKITPQFRAHPDVLEIRWQICAKEKKWDACRDLAASITQLDPARDAGWIHLAYSTRRASDGGLEKARTILLSAGKLFPNVSIIPYNLACYECQLGNLKEALLWLGKAIDLAGKKDIRAMALDDPDLKPLWKDISEI